MAAAAKRAPMYFGFIVLLLGCFATPSPGAGYYE
jgi:protein-S-isoprenylcysteine O-methyltransferase Ste14